MIKRILSAVFLCLLLIMIPLTGFASETRRVMDDAQLLSEDEELALEEAIAQLRHTHELDVAIVTVWNLGSKTAQEYADDFYDDHGYGVGEDYSGILLLLAMESREWYISTCGEAIYIFTDYGLEEMGNAILPYLSSSRYYDAFSQWLYEIPYYCDAYSYGQSVDGYVPPDGYLPQSGEQIVYPHYQRDTTLRDNGISLVAGFIIAVVAILVMRGTMNTAKAQASAADYLKNGTYHLKIRRDMYLYSRVTKTAKPQNNGGGGSSVHRSSGGRSHGGRGGRF